MVQAAVQQLVCGRPSAAGCATARGGCCRAAAAARRHATSPCLPWPVSHMQLPLLPPCVPGAPRSDVSLADELSPPDGGLYLATPLDPLLVALPLLERARAQQNVFQDLEQILRWGAALQQCWVHREGCKVPAWHARQRLFFGGLCLAARNARCAAPPAPACSMAASPSAHQLLPLLAGGGQLGCICDVKAAGGQSYFRLSDDKVRRGGGGQAAVFCLAAPLAQHAACVPPLALLPLALRLQVACAAAAHFAAPQVVAWLRLKVEQAKAAMQASPNAAFRCTHGACDG